MSGTYPLGDRLNFTLPDFLRLSWVSDNAREVWVPRFKSIVAAWGVVESKSVLYEVRKCALVKSSSNPDGLMADASDSQRVVVLKLDTQADRTLAPDNEAPSHFGIGDSSAIEELRRAWLRQDHDGIGRLLGYPPCCTRAYCERYATGDFTDPIWPISQGGSSANGKSERQADIGSAASPSCNVFWRLLGIRPVPHLPCRFDCDATATLGKSFFDLGHRLGFAAEIEWLTQILSWPVEWSALHGIAEIKTPILKMSTATDATAWKMTVRWAGSGYPSEGAQAIRFPYHAPPRLSVTESAAYQRGLAEHSRLPDAPTSS
jgi:hypothetical protein